MSHIRPVSRPLMLTLLLAIFSIPLFFFVDESYANNSITVTISGNPTVTIAPTSEGTFADSSNINISVSNAPSSGYTLAITGSNNTSLVGKTDNTKSITSISAALDQTTFNTSTYNNKWGYKPSMHYNTSTGQRANNSNYLPAPDANGDIIDITDDNSSNNYTLSIGARVTYDLGFQTYENNTFVIAAVGNMVDCDNTKLCVQYDGNGLTYDGENVNKVNYNSTISSTPTIKYAHTPNINDSGTASGTYPTGSVGLREIVSIPGASSVSVTLSYSIEENWDYLYVFAGGYNGTITGSQNTPMSAGQLYTFTGGSSTTSGSNSTTFTVSGDTVTFAFWSDPGTAYYGYYATITGYGYDRSVASGEYATPTSTNAVFNGWSTTQTTPGGGLPSQVEYADESEVMVNIPGNEGDTKTLYAVWQQEQTITFNMDNNTSSIDILDSNGATVKIITASGQTATLAQGSTYTINPTHSSIYTTDTITKTSGAGTLNGRKFTAGAGSTTINITSRTALPMQNWTSCSSLAVGDTEKVYDTRDGELYLIGKLADDKCWMLENLNLAGGIALSSANTNVTDDYISSFSTSNNLTKSDNTIVLPASSNSGFNVSNYSYVYNTGNKTSNCGRPGCYSYYSWDAATLGSGRGIRTNNTNAQQSICPKGWKLPSTFDGYNYSTNFRALIIALGGSSGIQSYSSSTSPTAATLYDKLVASPYNFLLAGDYEGSSFRSGYGHYWSSTSFSTIDSARSFIFNNYTVYLAADRNRAYGMSVRCLFSE